MAEWHGREDGSPEEPGVYPTGGFQKSMEALMAAVEKVEPPHEPEGEGAV